MPSPALLGGTITESESIPCWKGSQRWNPPRRGAAGTNGATALLGVRTACSCPMEPGLEAAAGSSAAGSAVSFPSARRSQAGTCGRAQPGACRRLAKEVASTGIEGKRPQKSPTRTEGGTPTCWAANRACCRAGPFTEGAALPSKWGCDNAHRRGFVGSADGQKDTETSPTCKCGAQRFAYEIRHGPQRPQPYLGTAARRRRCWCPGSAKGRVLLETALLALPR